MLEHTELTAQVQVLRKTFAGLVAFSLLVCAWLHLQRHSTLQLCVVFYNSFAYTYQVGKACQSLGA